jgi:signal transduction histidine kinase
VEIEADAPRTDEAPRTGRPTQGAPIGTRVLPGLFPPRPFGLDEAVRRVLLALLLFLALGGAAAYLALSRGADLAAPIVVAVVASAAAAVVPWHRFPRDAFAAVGIGSTAWVVWFVALTGGAGSPHVPLTFVAVAMCAVPLSRGPATILGLVAAAASALPLAYQDATPREAQELATRAIVLAVAALFVPWLMDEVRKVVRIATVDRERLASEQGLASELKRVQNVRQEYLSVLAHELRNPLTAINAAARVLTKDIAGSAGEGMARGIATEAHHAMELLDGLTDVASLESGRMRLALRPIDLAQVLTETSGTTVDGHTVVMRGTEHPITVLGDDRRLGQVVRNLVTNAAKYSPVEADITVSLGVSADRKNAIVQVRDAGPGIPPAERGRLFQKFARLSTAGATRGSGLGLYISRGIVNDHGGEMWADWPAGGGSVFSFSVPLTGEGART